MISLGVVVVVVEVAIVVDKPSRQWYAGLVSCVGWLQGAGMSQFRPG